jgi:signal transduction histidine kinase
MPHGIAPVNPAESLDLAPLIVRDPHGRITGWSRGAARLYGFTDHEALGSLSQELLGTRFPEPLADIHAHLEQFGVWKGELSRRTRAGIAIDVASVWVLNRDSQGQLSSILESDVDLIERNQAEHRLTAQFGRLKLLNTITRAIGMRQDLHSIAQVLIGTLEDQLPVDFGCVCLYEDPDSLVIAGVGLKSANLNAALGLAEHTHIPLGENGLAHCVRGELVYEPDLAALPFPFPQSLSRTGLSAMVAAPLLVEKKVFGVLIVARRAAHSFTADECEFLSQLSGHVALAAHQAQLHGALESAYRDLRETQQAAMRQEKLRVLGQMASGIAHDINNALAPAAFYLESMLEGTMSAAKTRKYLLIVQRAIGGIAQTVARMKQAYSQHDPLLEHRPFNLNKTVKEVTELTHAQWNTIPEASGMVINLAVDLAADLPPIIGAESEIRDALTNLLLNAVDAMPEGGHLVLRSRAIGSQNVQLEISDTGMGMDAATLSRCAEIFFTTKGARGSGLGLTMVHATMESHGGEIEIDSHPGAGTTVRLTLPIAGRSLADVSALPKLTAWRN